MINPNQITIEPDGVLLEHRVCGFGGYRIRLSWAELVAVGAPGCPHCGRVITTAVQVLDSLEASMHELERKAKLGERQRDVALQATEIVWQRLVDAIAERNAAVNAGRAA
jgi:hypothetical protein